MKTYDLTKAKKDNELNIGKELERYELILDYFNENPKRVENNESYLMEITDRLVDISIFNKKISFIIKDLSSKLLKDFLNKNHGYEYL
ncbi:hypothetical protein KAT24_03035 [Candidatus Pacearchaeota archaeon]|nr:hypothetical protein [Candidatus Pacearchaeota archaeon]